MKKRPILTFVVITFLLGAYPLNARASSLKASESALPGIPHPILSSLEVRQAIAHCTDKWAIARSVYPDLTEAELEALITDTFLPKDHWAYVEPTVKYDYDPEKGKLLLEQAGWTLPAEAAFRVNAAGEELAMVLTTTTAEYRQTWAALFEQQMADCGIRVARKHVSPEWMFGDSTGLSRRDFELAAYAWQEAPGADPDVEPMYTCENIPSAQNGWQGQNYMGWCNPAASEAAKQANNLALTQEQRKAHYATLIQEFAKDVPTVPLFFLQGLNAWEHVDMNLLTPIREVYLPVLMR